MNNGLVRGCEWCGNQPDVDLNGPWTVICGCAEDQPANASCALTREDAIRVWNESQRQQAIDSGKCTRCTHYPATTERDLCAECHCDWQCES